MYTETESFNESYLGFTNWNYGESPAANFSSSNSSNLATIYTPTSASDSQLDENMVDYDTQNEYPRVFECDFPLPLAQQILNELPNEMNEIPMNDDTVQLHNRGSISDVLMNFNCHFSDASSPGSQTVSSRNSGVSRRQGPLPDDTRKSAAETRKKGACAKCKISKTTCKPGPNPDSPCRKCISLLEKKTHNLADYVMPCWRPKFADIELIRLGPTVSLTPSFRGLPNHATSDKQLPWEAFKTTASEGGTYKIVELSQGWIRNTLKLRLDRYLPEDGIDKTYYSWSDNGVPRAYNTALYAIAWNDDAIYEFLNDRENAEAYIHAHMDYANPITRRTFDTAIQKASEMPLVQLCLKLWVGCRFIEKPWSIIGSETLGMALDPNPNSPYHQRIPVPPIVDLQIDLFVINKQLQETLKLILKNLKKKMSKPNDDWFEIQLAYFILLHNVELTMAHDVEFARLHNLHERFSNKPLINMVTHGAQTLLALFHYVHRGFLPYYSGNNAGRGLEEKAFINDISTLVSQLPCGGDHVHDPAKELFWTSQLYSQEYRPVVFVV